MATAVDPRRLYREIVDIEKQLRELLRSNPLNAQDANVLRNRLVDRARVLAQAHPTFAAQRELEQVLWKPCFYKRIEDFRRRIRKYASAPSSDRTVREHFARVSHEFQEFLRDAAQFYENLREYFTKWLLTTRGSRITIASSANGNGNGNGNGNAPASQQDMQAINSDKCRTSLHRCLVFLGDLARYRELHSQKAKKNFVAAEGFYHKALAVIPENGNPHNQLAVLATYVEAETVAVYRYCRSLLIAQPFATAEENLALLFERSRQRPQAPPTTAQITNDSSAKDKSLYLKSFLHRLTRMHGVLFSIATREKTTSSGASSSVAVYSKEMESLLIKDLVTLLRTGVVGDALMVKLVVTNIFCLVKAAETSAMDDALRLSLRMVSTVLAFLATQLGGENGGSSNATNLPNGLRLAGAVSTFFDYLRLNPRVLDTMDAMLSATNGNVVEVNKRFATEFLESLVALLNRSKVQAIGGGADDERVLRGMQLQLKENSELRGFKPLSALVDGGVSSATKWLDGLAASAGAGAGFPVHGSHQSVNGGSQTSLSDQDAWRVRAWNLVRFGKFVCDEYDGNPLLYQYKGQFSTTPTVLSGISNGFLSTTTTSGLATGFTATTATASGGMGLGLGLFSNGGPLASPPPIRVASSSVPVQAATDDDDFDDEIILYKPSPALAPAQPRGQGSSALGGASNSVLGGSRFGSDSPFSLDASSSVFGNGLAQHGNQQQQQQQQPRLSLSSPSSLFGSFGGSSSDTEDSSTIGGASSSSPSLGYPGFNAFGGGGLGSFSGQSAFSGQGFLSAGWGGVATQAGAKSPVTSLSASFAAETQQQQQQRPQQQAQQNPSPFRGSLLGGMDDHLAAVERESALYQQKESSLSAFLRPSSSASSLAGVPPVPPRSASVGGARPPPGFASTGGASSPPGFARSATSASSGAPGGRPPQEQQFFTRNPFANP